MIRGAAVSSVTSIIPRMTSVLPPAEVAMNRTSTLLKQESQATDCQDALVEMLQTFRERDIRNFLFTDEAIEQPYFASPNFTKSAVTAMLSSKRFCGEHVEHVQGYMVYIPAFNIANRNLGFGYHYHYREDTKRHDMHWSARFVHDDTKGTFTTILQSQQPQDGQLIITYKKYLSATCQRRVTACFDRARFLKVLHDDGLAENLIGCLKQLLVGSEYRDCPYCGRERCDCCIVFKRAKHPFDDTVFKEDLGLLMGSFRGFAQVENYESGEIKNVNKVVCEMVVTGADNELLTERLRRWAVGDAEAGESLDNVWIRDEDGGLKLNVQREKGKKNEGVVSELKAALRRERNRASARKSNMKKKVLNDALKAAVREEHSRLEMLRSRELELRRRNLELRRLLAEE